MVHMRANHRGRGFRIGEMAARAGTTADTVRYYEQLGLLEAATRSEGGYRLYGQGELGRLQFIRRAKQLALQSEDQPACGCSAFPADCACLPIPLEEVTRSV